MNTIAEFFTVGIFGPLAGIGAVVVLDWIRLWKQARWKWPPPRFNPSVRPEQDRTWRTPIILCDILGEDHECWRN